MITVERAIQGLLARHPDKRIVSGMDIGDVYAFQMWGRSVNPQGVFDFPIGPAVTTVNKRTGEESQVHAYLIEGNQRATKIDVARYLGGEDAAFARRMEKLLSRMGGT